MKKLHNISWLRYCGDKITFTLSFNTKKVDTVKETIKNNTIIAQTVYDKKSKKLNILIWYGPINTPTLIYNSAEIGNSPSWCKNRYDYNINILTKEIKIRKHYSNEEARALLAETPHKIGKYDSFILNWDIQCVTCGEWMSNPIDGLVREVQSAGEDVTFYKNKFYQRVPFEQQHDHKYWNRSEYDALAIDYGSRWEDFDEVWDSLQKIAGQYYNGEIVRNYRDASGSLVYFSKPPVIGAYEKVVTKFWKVVPKPGLVPCPCCDTLHRIYSETSVYRPKFWRIKLDICYAIQKIRIKISNIQYRIKTKLNNIQYRFKKTLIKRKNKNE